MSHFSAQQRPGQIASHRSARVVASRKLQRRATRHAEEAFLADGPQAVREALTGGYVTELYVDAARMTRHRELLELAAAHDVPVVTCDANAIASLSEAVTPQGILARCRLLDLPFAQAVPVGTRLAAVPVEVRDPGNLGTIIRCADAAGAGAVAVLGDSVDLYNSKTVRASAGSLFHIPLSTEPDPIAGIAALRAAGMQIVATEGEAETDLDELIDAGGLRPPTAWLFGNEAHGLPDQLAALADVRVRIPIRGRAESLNLSTAAAICLFASARAHR